jgi:hypothetical protein
VSRPHRCRGEGGRCGGAPATGARGRPATGARARAWPRENQCHRPGPGGDNRGMSAVMFTDGAFPLAPRTPRRPAGEDEHLVRWLPGSLAPLGRRIVPADCQEQREFGGAPRAFGFQVDAGRVLAGTIDVRVEARQPAGRADRHRLWALPGVAGEGACDAGGRAGASLRLRAGCHERRGHGGASERGVRVGRGAIRFSPTSGTSTTATGWSTTGTARGPDGTRLRQGMAGGPYDEVTQTRCGVARRRHVRVLGTCPGRTHGLSRAPVPPGRPVRQVRGTGRTKRPATAVDKGSHRHGHHQG